MMTSALEQLVRIPSDHLRIEALLELPENAQGIVLFAHGSGSNRHSPRNNYVARVLRDAGIGTLLIDLLTPQEDLLYKSQFDIPLLTKRLLDATEWVSQEPATQHLPIAYFGSSIGAAVALQAAVDSPHPIAAVVSRSGRVDLAGSGTLQNIHVPTLLLVGGFDYPVIELNQNAYEQMDCPKALTIIPGATHLFEETGTREQVAYQTTVWLKQYLQAA
ncbi:MAG: dienelactone hydrolase family protein [Sulfuriferula sp.]|nr:dienelactone hydrolase family protein [Sulfuriferula sp.]